MAAGNQPGAWRALPILVVLYALSLLDRQVLSLMVGPIKRDLGISDFQIGLLQGLVFALFYSVASVPIGWLVDRFPRRPIVWCGVTIWGICAASCGLAQTFGQLLVARLGVGAGEAALAPAAYSMLADLFQPSRLAFALSVLLVGSTLGNGLAVGLGGAIVSFAEAGHVHSLPFLGEVASWQYVFIVTGLPGLVLGLLIFLLREPKRRDRLHATHPPLSATFRFIAERRGFFACHFIGFGLLAIVGWGFTSWLPVYMIRSFGWTIGQVTLPLALILGLGGSVGVLASGWLVDRLFGAGRADAHLRVYAAVAVLITVTGLAAFQVRDPVIFLWLAVPIAAAIPLGATAAAALQIVTPNEMRGQIGAMFLLVSNGLGLGLGPTLVGGLTDFVFRDEAKLGSSLTLMFAVLGPASAILLALGFRSMRQAVQLAEAWRSPTG
ncbi:MAG: MFS transporter [Phenylobacterium sp.]|nr:MFS transporter [Phenylobacterium sp.]MDP3747677.1 MFS transporter [Phenylobacterium sp.]